jgi:hypothetical protein
MDRIKIVAVALTTLMCTGCESGTNIEGAADVSPDCDAGECSQEFEKPPLAEEYESPASKLSVESDAYRQIAVEPRPFMRPGEDGAKAWLYSDESAIFDTSFLFDPRDIGEDFEEQEFVMYAFVNFRPVPFSVIRANSGNNTSISAGPRSTTTRSESLRPHSVRKESRSFTLQLQRQIPRAQTGLTRPRVV